MNEAVKNALRPDLTPLPPRKEGLPIDERGYPVPWFVPMVGGKPEFRAMDRAHFIQAIRLGLCWVCGSWLGSHKTFVTGPMCLISGTNAEPPSHWACATWSARNCPFLSKPQMVRRTNDLPEGMQTAGIPILRNPGVTAVATMRKYRVFNDGAGHPLIRMDLAGLEHVEWFSMGRPATRAEVQESVDGGLPILRGFAQEEGEDALEDLKEALEAFEKWMPKE